MNYELIMRYIKFMALMALFALVGCKHTGKSGDEAANSKYNPTDARSFGLVGDVKEVRVSVFMDNASEGESPWVESGKLLMTFDDEGRVTLDPFGNVYVYDADGNFIKGVTVNCTMERDSLGRVVSYGKKESDNDREMYSMGFGYDADGRMTTLERAYWEVLYNDTLTYSADNVYPSQLVSDGAVESFVVYTVEDYVYNKFDDKGNWTERECKTVMKTASALDDDDSNAEYERWTTTERRTISYYSTPSSPSPSSQPQNYTNPLPSEGAGGGPDIFGFGLLGPVKEVVTTMYTATDNGDERLLIGEVVDGSTSTISFDAKGRVTEDPFGGIYVYDADGKFVKGASRMSIMKRDDQERVVNYQTKQDDEDDAMFRNDYTYDTAGRLVKVNQLFWESTEQSTFVYDGDEIYPSKRLFDNYDEGLHTVSETTYHYTQFDDHGNWTERELRYQGSESEEGGEGSSSVTRFNGAMIEKRTITYY